MGMKMVHLSQYADDSTFSDFSCLGPWGSSMVHGQLQDIMYLGTGHPEHGADMNIRGGQAGFMRSLADGDAVVVGSAMSWK